MPGKAVCPSAVIPQLRSQLQFRLRFSLGLSLVSGGVFVWLKLTRPDFIVVVQHRARGGVVLLGDDIDHETALLGNLPDVSRGRVSLAQLGIVREQRVRSAWHRSRTARTAWSAPVKTDNAEAGSGFQAWLPCRISSIVSGATWLVSALFRGISESLTSCESREK
jgi:hypothetical protein